MYMSPRYPMERGHRVRLGSSRSAYSKIHVVDLAGGCIESPRRDLCERKPRGRRTDSMAAHGSHEFDFAAPSRR
jgi:hypothetical protein